MTNPKNIDPMDKEPAEGSRDVVERELARQDDMPAEQAFRKDREASKTRERG